MDEEMDERVYRVTYKLYVDDIKTIMGRVAEKAVELNVRGYITYTYSGDATSGELQGTEKELACMMSWLQHESREGDESVRFGPLQVLLRPGYDDFFCCC